MASNPREATLMSALSTLPQPNLSHLTAAIATTLHHHHRRLVSLVTSPILFSLTLRRLQDSSLHDKYLLISRLLLSNLTLLHHFMPKTTAALPSISATRVKLRDLDAVLLLLLLCELHQYRPELLQTRPEQWRGILREYVKDSMLGLSTSRSFCSITHNNSHEVLMQFVECIGRCWNFVNAMDCADGGGEGGKLCPEASASVAAVVVLPSVEVAGGTECVICKEDMEKGRGACELPCGHLFHWVCVLKWLKKKDTCPCCRHRLPSDDVRREIDRLFEEFIINV